ncbi:MAG: radical SAM protein [Eudoraea sp.]|nr:radical SAM protein [Eudoraea sp.]
MEQTSIVYPESLAVDQKLEQTEDLAASDRGLTIVTGWRKSWIHLRLKGTLLKVLIRCYPNPIDWIRGLRYLIQLRRKVIGNHRVRKMIRVGKLYYMGLHAPGWNDSAYRKFIASELYHFKPHNQPRVRFNQLYQAITKKCPLQCEHCSAWDTLNMKDELGLEEYQQLIRDVEREGLSAVYFTGGEPMVKFELLQNLISGLAPDTRAWMSTSGFHFTSERAKLLKEAGLTGVFVSLDHYDEDKHNTFRNYKDAYSWALRAAKNALDAGLVVAFSVCLSEELSTEEELSKYRALARNTGVHFVQFFEPRAVGHYKNKDVELSREAIQRVEAFFLKMNFRKEHLDYPLISYHGYYQRRVGCFAAGKRVLYIDADGNINSCPFCQKSYGNALEGGLDEKVQQMSGAGCSTFS